MRSADRGKRQFNQWIESANSTTYRYVIFVAAQEIVRHGKPFTDGEYIKKKLFIKISDHLFTHLKKQE